MPRTRAELDAIRATNRQALGLADYLPPETQTAALAPYPGIRVHAQGMAGTVPGGMGGPMDLLRGGFPPIKVGSAFPNVEYVFDPSKPGEAASTKPGGDSGLAVWMNRHVFRPYVEAGPVKYSPGDGYADYSPVANVAAVGLAALGTGGVLWVLYRAFFGGKRS